MSEPEHTTDRSPSSANQPVRAGAGSDRHARVAAICAAVGVGMLGMSYAAVPLYQMFCQVTGFGGTTQRAVSPSATVLDRTLTMRFDANTSPKLPWDFKPVTSHFDVKLGENRIAHFTATNTSDQTLWGTATFNVSPESAGVYFNKIQCFCFTEQKLEPGETVDMPVTFFVDPGILADKDAGHVSQITLSYTFFPLEQKNSEAHAKNGETTPPVSTTTKDAG